MIALSALLLSAPLESKNEVIREARALAVSAEKHAERTMNQKQMFMQDAQDEAKWTRMKKDDEHLDADGLWSSGDVAYVWAQNKKISFVSISSGSQSGDWMASAEYTYRADGSLARLEARFAAFSPVEGAVVRERIFDKAGKLIHEGVKCTTLGHPAKLLSKEEAAEIKQYAPRPASHLKPSDLPFAPLLAARP